MPRQKLLQRSKHRRRKLLRLRQLKPSSKTLRRIKADRNRLYRKWVALQQSRAIRDHDLAVLEAERQRRTSKYLLPPVDPRWDLAVLRWLAR